MNTAAANPPPDSDGEANETDDVAAPRAVRRWSRSFAAAMRWLHIYLSMFGFTTLLLFSVTGVTLNHPDWFGATAARTEELHGEIDKRWVAADQPVDQLAIAEWLRAQHHLRGKVGEFRVDEFECLVSFQGPGYAADAFLDRETGRYDLTVVQHGTVALLNDLHKGRDSGAAWSVVVDVSAVLMSVSAVTGLVLLFYLKRRRTAGLVTALVGTLVLLAIFVWLVP